MEHALIGVEERSGQVRFIKLHIAGDLEHAGVILNDHYRARAKVEQLIALGDISDIAESIGVKHDFDPLHRPLDEVTAYHRDRGDTLQVHKASNRAAFWRWPGAENYRYLYNSIGQWLVKVGDKEPAVLSAAVIHD